MAGEEMEVKKRPWDWGKGNGHLCGWPSNGSLQRSFGALLPDRRSAAWRIQISLAPGRAGSPWTWPGPYPLVRLPYTVLHSKAYVVFLKLETPTLLHKIAPWNLISKRA